MKKLLFLILGFACLSGEIHAMPLLQRHVQGVVRSIDQENHLIVIEPEGKQDPGEFIVEDKRTRLRRDDLSAVLGDLTVGQRVKLYYKKEQGRCVATEVIWQSVGPVVPPK